MSGDTSPVGGALSSRTSSPAGRWRRSGLGTGWYSSGLPGMFKLRRSSRLVMSCRPQ
ncbi:MAG: hypothetical protein MJE68_13790 [Proteobacteria bacterium]|nr:hypothetical protein [Pseudomonadota bacterium]